MTKKRQKAQEVQEAQEDTKKEVGIFDTEEITFLKPHGNFKKDDKATVHPNMAELLRTQKIAK